MVKNDKVMKKQKDFFQVKIVGQKYVYTKEQEQYIINQYINNKKSPPKIGQEFGVSYYTIWKVLKKYNIFKIDTTIVYQKDINFFKKIDTEEKAYWLGFLYADGNITYSKEKCAIRLGLQEQDKEHLEKFLVSLKSTHKIKSTDKKVGEKIFQGFLCKYYFKRNDRGYY